MKVDQRNHSFDIDGIEHLPIISNTLFTKGKNFSVKINYNNIMDGPVKSAETRKE